jgi:exopolyphosphatase/guanosine-5'-triphosphate,3'-diphosphate pyrophosphatase
MHKRVAAIDCGTNSIRLLVADLSLSAAGAYLVDVHREMRVVRLGEGVDATGRLSPSALDRTWRALADYTAILRASGAVTVRMTATSATRDAANRDEFTAMVRRTLGQDPEVISGAEEAELSFRGAVGDLPATDGPFLVVDIGGGSTELVVGSVDPADGGGVVTLAGSTSLNIGCVRITERLLPSDPPTAGEIAAAAGWARELLSDGLDALGGTLGSVRRMVAVSGTATTVAAASLQLPSYDPVRIHLSRIPVGDLRKVSEILLAATRAHRAALGYMHPGRVDVIGGGSLILATIAELVAQRTGLDEVTISEHDILDGIALSLA